jgi:hypothetical protein
MDYTGKMEVIEDAGENFSFRLAGKEFVARGDDVLHTLRGLIREEITLTVPPCDDVEADRFANSEDHRFIERIKRTGHGRYEIDLGS